MGLFLYCVLGGSAWRKRLIFSIRKFIDTHTHTHVYIYVCVCVILFTTAMLLSMSEDVELR